MDGRTWRGNDRLDLDVFGPIEGRCSAVLSRLVVIFEMSSRENEYKEAS